MRQIALELLGILAVIAVLAGLALVSFFGVGAMRGAPWLPSRKLAVKLALELLDLKPGQTLIDLGSGSGEVLIAAARQGIHAIGYELNPILWLISRLRTRKYKNLVKVKLGDYWRIKLPPADGIYVFLIDHYMAKLDQKLKTEVTQPTKVASLAFKIPGKEIAGSRKALYLYRYP